LKATVFHNPRHISVDTVEDPKIKKNDGVILKVTSTAISGYYLHIYDGFFLR